METEILLSLAVILVGSTVQGLTGLGFALLTVPVMLLYRDPRSVVMIVLILSLLLNALILLQARGQVTLRDAGPITLGTVLGVPFGTYLLVVMPVEGLKLMVSGIVLVFSVPLLLGYTRRFRHPRAASVVTGAVSGAIQGSTSMGGPAAALFLSNLGLSKETFRGTMVVRSIVASSISVVVLFASGMLDSGIATQALLLLPALLAGSAIGNRLIKRVPPAIFQRITVLVVAGAALVSLVGALL